VHIHRSECGFLFSSLIAQSVLLTRFTSHLYRISAIIFFSRCSVFKEQFGLLILLSFESRKINISCQGFFCN
jgi:hypothetical protein